MSFTDAFVAGVQAYAEAIRASANDPADQTRILANCASYAPAVTASTAPIGAAIATIQTATSAVCRRAAISSLARAVANYQPTSYDDAAALRAKVAGIIGAEITVAGDAGDTASYVALRALRTAIVQDLTARGALLPSLVTVQRAIPMPSLVIAYALYGDATRSEELMDGAGDVPHPGFMPLEFTALGT